MPSLPWIEGFASDYRFANIDNVLQIQPKHLIVIFFKQIFTDMNIKHCYGNVSQLRKDFSTNALEIKMGSGCSKLQKVFNEDDLKAFMVRNKIRSEIVQTVSFFHQKIQNNPNTLSIS